MHLSLTFTHALPALFLHAIVMCNFYCLYLGTLNLVWRWIMIIPKIMYEVLVASQQLKYFDGVKLWGYGWPINLIIICNISTYVNNNNKCDPSGFSDMTVWKIRSPGCRSLNVPQRYIILCFVPFVLFFAQHWTCSCFLLYTFIWHWMKNIFFFTKLSVTFFPMTCTWQRYYNENLTFN
jgi:hypothetical protein